MLYSDDFNDKTFYQGDVIRDVPVSLPWEDKYLILNDEGGGYSLEKQDFISEITTFQAAHEGVISAVMIISQTCDINNRDTVLVAPVLPLKKLLSSGSIKSASVDSIRTRKDGTFNYLFYLQADEEKDFEESVVDLQHIQPFSPQLLTKHLPNRVLVLSDWGRHHLGWKVSTLFGRPVRDKSE